MFNATARTSRMAARSSNSGHRHRVLRAIPKIRASSEMQDAASTTTRLGAAQVVAQFAARHLDGLDVSLLPALPHPFDSGSPSLARVRLRRWHTRTPQDVLRIARSWRLRVASGEDSLQGTGRLRGASLRLVRSCG